MTQRLTAAQVRILRQAEGFDVERDGTPETTRLRQRGLLELDHSGPRTSYRVTEAGRAALRGALGRGEG